MYQIVFRYLETGPFIIYFTRLTKSHEFLMFPNQLLYRERQNGMRLILCELWA